MNFPQKLALFILITITCAYIYFSFFNKDFKLLDIKLTQDENISDIKNDDIKKENINLQNVKIFILDENGKLRAVNRECNQNLENSCFAYAISELIKAPSRWEKSKGFTSEIPINTKILSVRESNTEIMIDLSSEFALGGGTESNYKRMKQLIKTANANTKLPVYLYMNGNQVNVFGSEGIMIKQPLNGASLDE